MNAYVAEIIAAERMTEFQREVACSRLIREARRGTRPRAAHAVRVARFVAAAGLAITLCLSVAS